MQAFIIVLSTKMFTTFNFPLTGICLGAHWCFVLHLSGIKVQAKQDAYGTTAQCSIALGPQLIGQWQHQPGES